MFLLSDDASYITGQILAVDGGLVHVVSWGYGDLGIGDVGGATPVPDVGIRGASSVVRASAPEPGAEDRRPRDRRRLAGRVDGPARLGGLDDPVRAAARCG